jgi:hypothetical protein
VTILPTLEIIALNIFAGAPVVQPPELTVAGAAIVAEEKLGLLGPPTNLDVIALLTPLLPTTANILSCGDQQTERHVLFSAAVRKFQVIPFVDDMI